RRRRDRRLADRDRIRPGRSGRPARVPDLGDGAREAPPRPPAGRHRRRRVARRGRPPASGVGGGGIQARGPSRVRVATAAAALALAGALAVASAVTADGPRVGWLWALALIGSAGRIGHGPALARTLAGALCAIAILAVVAWVSPARASRRATTDRPSS